MTLTSEKFGRKPLRWLTEGLLKAWKLISAIGTVLGLAAAVVVFLPRVSVVSSGLTDVTNPWIETFTITNTGYIPLEKVLPAAGICFVATHGASVSSATTVDGLDPSCRNPKGDTYTERWLHFYLGVGQPFTILFSDMFSPENPPLEGADITINVSYQPWFIPYRKTDRFRFVAQKQVNGQIVWRQVPWDE